MYFLLETCENPNLLRIIFFIKQLIDVVFIIVPIGLILFIIIDFAKAMMSSNGDGMKKSSKITVRRIVYAVALFFVPLIVNIATDALEETLDSSDYKSYLTCWTNANKEKIAIYQEQLNIEEELEELKQNEWWQEQLAEAISNLQEEEKNNVAAGKGEKPTGGTILVGDSRMVGVCSTISSTDDVQCIAEESKGLDWLKKTAVAQVNSILETDTSKVYNIVINLGINDLLYIGSREYYEYYRELVDNDWQDQNVIIVSVDPLDENTYEYNYSLDNATISDFNRIVETQTVNLGAGYYYCNTYDTVYDLILNSDGTTRTEGIQPDGLHFTTSTYRIIYGLLQSCISNYVPSP